MDRLVRVSMAVGAAMLCSVPNAMSVEADALISVHFTTNAVPVSAAVSTPTVVSFTDDTELSGKDVLTRLTAQPTAPIRTTSFGAGNLSLLVERTMPGGEPAATLYNIGDCNDIELDQAEGDALPDRARCDGRAFSLTLVQQGLGIMVDAELQATLELRPGAYLINGVPYRIN